MKLLNHIFPLFLLLPLLTSCEDWFSQAPESEMVREDFWKKKGDVESAIGACYRSLAEYGIVERLIVWGEGRSDNFLPGKSTETNLSLLLSANISPSNAYTQWGLFYTCINNCNTLLQFAPGVREADPDFSESELRQYVAEATAIRAFCYFTLARTFKEIAYTEQAYTDDSRSFMLPAAKGDSVCALMLSQLRAIEQDAPDYWSNNIPYNRGRITQRAVLALEADIALWLQRYEDCVSACDRFLALTSNPLSLVRSSAYFRDVFTEGNSTEGIWELQFDQNNQNGAVRDFYGLNTDCRLSSYDFSFTGTSSNLFLNQRDLRHQNAFVSSSGFYVVKKYIATRTNTQSLVARESDFQNGEPTCNWILYRLPDIYLMKAEALAELGSEANLQEAVRLCGLTYDRANPDLEAGSLTGQYTSQADVRNLVLDERQREFLFEGKRYFDLMRRIRREGSTEATISAYLMNKYIAMNVDRTTVTPKISDIDAIYLPINEEELRLDTLLHQNRFYETSNDITR